jgi:glycosyltransferase involved in cell wall biosynthesis
MDNEIAPLVSLALPLYKSKRFLEIITANLDTLSYPNLEILISDRHCADDTLEVLHARYGHEPRVRFFRARDELNWIEHYNFLLGVAQGKYFLWMPHDDLYPSNYLSVLVNSLEKNPAALLAYGWVEGHDENGSITIYPPAAPFSNDDAWTTRLVLRLCLVGELWVGFRGVFRRDLVMQKKLFMQPTPETAGADVIWLIALALAGRFCWVPELAVRKRFYPTSTHKQWKPYTFRQTLQESSALRVILLDSASTFRAKARGILVFLFWGILRSSEHFLRAVRFDPVLRRRVRRFVARLIHPSG